jgi:murein DD-endopeptidase MepM/ murein hydrolase activator NlpD
MKPLNTRLRVLLLAVVVLASLAALIWFLSARDKTTPVTPVALPEANDASDAPVPANAATPLAPASVDAPAPVSSPSPDASPAASPSPAASASATPTPQPTATPNSQTSFKNFPTPNPPAGGATASNSASGATGKLLVPVAGVRPEQLQDTYTQSRSEGRVHNAIDIPAARGTPVLAAADGAIVKLFNSDRGGITIYQLGTDRKTIYYYAHLERYADGISEGHFARRGETIAYVGDTGNAGAGNYHLHFSVSLVSDPKRYWDGENINPYPLLVK